MHHSGVYELRILNCSYWVFKRCQFWQSVKVAVVCFTHGILYIELDCVWVEHFCQWQCFFFSRMFARLAIWFFKGVSFGQLSNLHTCLSRVNFYRVGERAGRRFLPMWILFLFAGMRAFSDAPYPRFRYSKLCVMGVWHMPNLAICQICAGVFHALNSIELHSVWVADSCQCKLSFFLRVLARLAMRHRGVCESLNPKLWLRVFKRCQFWSSVKFSHVCLTRGILSSWSER